MDQPPVRKKRGRGYYYNEEHYRKCQAAKQERFKRNRFVAQTRAVCFTLFFRLEDESISISFELI